MNRKILTPRDRKLKILEYNLKKQEVDTTLFKPRKKFKTETKESMKRFEDRHGMMVLPYVDIMDYFITVFGEDCFIFKKERTPKGWNGRHLLTTREYNKYTKDLEIQYNLDEYYYRDEKWLEVCLRNGTNPPHIHIYRFYVKLVKFIYRKGDFLFLILWGRVWEAFFGDYFYQYRTDIKRSSTEGRYKYYKKEKYYMCIYIYAMCRETGVTVIHFLHCNSTSIYDLNLFYSTIKLVFKKLKKGRLRVTFRRLFLYENKYKKSFRNSTLWQYSGKFIRLMRVPHYSNGDITVLEEFYNVESYCVICDAYRRTRNPFFEGSTTFRSVRCDMYRYLTGDEYFVRDSVKTHKKKIKDIRYHLRKHQQNFFTDFKPFTYNSDMWEKERKNL